MSEEDKCWECDMPAVVKYYSPWAPEEGEPHCARCAEEGGYNDWVADPSSSVAGRDAGYWVPIVK